MRASERARAFTFTSMETSWLYSRYEGEWSGDKRNGRGSFFYASSGEKYEGQWLNGEKNGMGVYTYAYGDKYEGQWSGNKAFLIIS